MRFAASLTGTPNHALHLRDRHKNLSQVFGGQKVGVKQTAEHVWLISFVEYDLGYFDDETCGLEPIEDPFGPRLSPVSPE